MSETAVIEAGEKMPAAQPEQAISILQVIDRAARDPNVDIDKMERLMQMHERIQTNHARQVYQSALARMQPELPVVRHRGDAARRYTYALWEDIHRGMTPVLNKYGFALFFNVETGEQVKVTGILTHEDGHREQTEITLPADSSGNKNAVQAVASSVAYGKRYTAGALLNFATTGEDDDAQSAVQIDDPLTDAQVIQLQDRLDALGLDKAELLSKCGRAMKRDIPTLSAIPAALFPKCDEYLSRLEAQ